MKKIIFFSVAMLCLLKMVNGQTEIITFPTEGSVFQANSSGVFKITFGGQVKNPNPMFYRIEKRNGPNSWQVIVNDAALSTNFGALTGGIGRGVFSTTYNSNLSKGWYRLSIYRKWNNWFGLNTVRSMRHQIQFGVGDVYFIAGQSNASGYGGSNYKVQSLSGGLDNTVSSIMNNTNHSPMARVLNIRTNEQMIEPALNNPQRMINYSIPYKTGFSEFKNGTIANPFENSNSNERVVIYPNGYNSWYWGPLAHKIADPNGTHIYSGTPTMWFNVGSPSTALQDNGLDIVNIWNINESLNTSQRTSFLNRPFNQTLMGKFKQTLETYAGPFGAKGVLWHQGETDHEAITDDNSNVSALGYQSSLNAIINKSREYATGSSSNTTLNWFVAKATLFPKSASIVNSTISSGINISSLPNNGSYVGNQTDKLYTSSTLRNNQTSTLANVFEGPNTDDINSTNESIQRSSHYFVHFSGNSLQKAADDWYSKLNQTTNSLPPTVPLKITQVVKNSATSYTLTVDNSIGSTEFIWLVDGYGINNWDSQSTTNSVTFNGVQSDQFLHGYAKKNGRWHAIIPFMVPGGSIETKKLVLSENNLPAPTQGGILNTKVTSVDTEWEIQSGFPSWMSVSYDQDETTLNVNVSPNNSTSSRSGIVQLVESGGGLSSSLTITQSGSSSSSTPLTSLTPTNSSSQWAGYGTARFNGTNTVGGTMQVSGITYSQGIGTHANSSIVYNLNGQYQTFQGKVGRDDASDNIGWDGGKVIFSIKTNGNTVWTSSVHGHTTNAQNFSIPVSDINTLELIVNEHNDFNYSDWANWMDLFLINGGGGSCTNATPTNVSASPSSLSSSGGSSTLSATCAGGAVANWSTGATGSTTTINTTITQSYTVHCAGGTCLPSTPLSVTVTVPPASGCGVLTGTSVNIGTFTPAPGVSFPLIARFFGGNWYLTQKIHPTADHFMVRGSNMLTRGDVTLINSSYINLQSCFAWGVSGFGGLGTPTETEFQTPAGFIVGYECNLPAGQCNAGNGTPFYYPSTNPPPPNCTSPANLVASWTYANSPGGIPKIGNNIENGAMAMGSVNYSSSFPGTGIGTHANSEIVYDLGVNHPYTHFRSIVGKDNASMCGSWAGQEKIRFKLINNANGALIHQSPFLGNPSSGMPQTFDFTAAITGIRYIKLVVEDGGDEIYCDWANWARARLTCSASGRVAATDSLEHEFIQIVPNPNNGSFEVRVYLEEDSPLEISLVSPNGVVLESIKANGMKGDNIIPYQTKKTGSGRYLIRVSSKDKVQSTVVVIE